MDASQPRRRTRARKGPATSNVCRASSRVGDTTTAPTCGGARGRAAARWVAAHRQRVAQLRMRVYARVRSAVPGRASCALNACSACAPSRMCTSGSTNASVLPDPVHASTATSLLVHSSGYTAACATADAEARQADMRQRVSLWEPEQRRRSARQTRRRQANAARGAGAMFTGLSCGRAAPPPGGGGGTGMALAGLDAPAQAQRARSQARAASPMTQAPAAAVAPPIAARTLRSRSSYGRRRRLLLTRAPRRPSGRGRSADQQRGPPEQPRTCAAAWRRRGKRPVGRTTLFAPWRIAARARAPAFRHGDRRRATRHRAAHRAELVGPDRSGHGPRRDAHRRVRVRRGAPRAP